MRRTRAIGIFGLVLGLSGCAGTHQHQHFPATGPMPHRPHGPGLVQAGCGCRPVGAAQLAGMGGRPAPVVATVASRPGVQPMLPVPHRSIPPVSTASRATVPSQSLLRPGTPLPPSAQPVAVPAPAGVARHYFPMFEDDGTHSVWDPVPPDLLGVRTSMVPTAGAESEAAAPLSHDALESLSRAPVGSTEPVRGPLSEATPRSVAVAPADLGAYRGDLVPVSAEMSVPPTASTGQLPPSGAVNLPLGGPDLAVGDASAQPAKTLVLEHADAAELAGRPRWQPPTEPALAAHDQDEPSSWVSELAFQRPKKSAGLDLHLGPIVRGDVRPTEPRRTTVVSRFVRRLRVAGHAFLDPDSVRREASDLSKQGQGVERVSTDRLGESTKR